MVAPFTLCEVKIEVDFDAVEFGQTPLGEAPEGFDAVDVSAAVGEGLLFVDADVLVVTDIDQAVITRPAIRAEDALGINPASDHRAQGGLATVLNDFGVNLAVAFEDAEDRLLARPSAAPSRQSSAAHPVGTKVTLVDFYDPLKLTPFTHSLQSNQESKPVIERVHGLAIEPQQPGGLRRRQIETKTLHNLFYPITRQLAPLEHLE